MLLFAGFTILSLPGITPIPGARLSPCFHTVLSLSGGRRAIMALWSCILLLISKVLGTPPARMRSFAVFYGYFTSRIDTVWVQSPGMSGNVRFWR